MSKKIFLVDLVAKNQARLDELYSQIPKELREIVSEIVELEISLEADSNQ